ncbi:MAG: SDR family NAD(P)-dependent oxidoreductase [Proteobacteria bacterium]|nr:SDR family NAD(P)-dependent oxidoreductase [Pseudomonadota bacterium]
MVSLADKTALITGAGSGIGRESAIRMAADGAMIMCSDVNGAAAESVANVINQQGGRAEAMALDVTDEDAVRQAIEATAKAFGHLDIMFNNAGIGGALEWDKTIAVNLSGVFYGVHHGAAYMANHGGGSIINTASIAGLVGLVGPEMASTQSSAAMPGTGAYIAAKHGVAGLTKQYAIMYARRGVRVNAIAPGYIETPMTQGFRDVPGGVGFLESLHPMGRLGQPEEIASAAAFLASDDASFITGVVLPVDGGYTAR